MLKHLPVAAALVVSAAALMAPSAAQAELYRVNATGVCQSNLPASDGLIRKRPLAIRNEGGTSAFISCSHGAVDGLAHQEIQIYVSNPSAAEADVTCTVVTGNTVFGGIYYPLPVATIAAGDSDVLSQTFDNAVDEANQVNVSCLMGPGTELDYLRADSVDPI